MNETEIRKYASLMQELGLTGLEITQKDNVVRLERTPATVSNPVTESVQVPVQALAETEDCIIRSPLVGVFYASPTESAGPYVTVGDHVKQGQTLCIVEAMKMFNEITAETDGIISEICASNGQMVEYGTELFRIRG